MTIRLVKKTIRAEKITKYNHCHDERGRFCSGDGRAVYSGTDYENDLKARATEQQALFYPDKTVDEVTEIIRGQDKEKFDGYLVKAKARLKTADERLNVNTEENVKKIEDSLSFALEVDCTIAKDAVESKTGVIIQTAVRKYVSEKTGMHMPKAGSQYNTKNILDFADGVSWAQKNLGITEKIDTFDMIDDELTNAVAEVVFMDKTRITAYSGAFSIAQMLTKKDGESGFHPKNTTVTSLGVHEAAHVFELQLCKKTSGDKIGLSTIRMENGSISEEILSRAAEKCGRPIEELTKEVSTYANKNTQEAFAECISDYYSNGDNAAELSKAVFKVATEEVNEIVEDFTE